MTTQQLIQGLSDIAGRKIPTDCILDMSPVIIEKLTRLNYMEEMVIGTKDASTQHKKNTINTLLNYLSDGNKI